jgi:catechol 2,3-dioxygenase-like lactoylglutathione lyase family enzyme
MKAQLDHVGIAVSELAASLAFFRDALGLEIHSAEEVPSQQVRAHFLHAGAAQGCTTWRCGSTISRRRSTISAPAASG